MSANTHSLDAEVGDERTHSASHIPPIVRIVLTQAARWWMRGRITTEKLKDQVARLSREELEPRGMSVLVQNLAREATRFFIVTAATGQVWEMIEIGPEAIESEAKNAWQVDS